MTVPRGDRELVAVTSAGARHEQLPVSVAAHPHRVSLGVPEVEIADDRNGLRIRSQHDEADARHTLARHRVRAKLVVETLVRALAEQVEVEVAQDRRKAIRVLELHGVVAEACPQSVVLRSVGNFAGEKPTLVDAFERRDRAAVVDHLDVGRIRQECAHDVVSVLLVAPEIAERVGMTPAQNGIVPRLKAWSFANTFPQHAQRAAQRHP